MNGQIKIQPFLDSIDSIDINLWLYQGIANLYLHRFFYSLINSSQVSAFVIHFLIIESIYSFVIIILSAFPVFNYKSLFIALLHPFLTFLILFWPLLKFFIIIGLYYHPTLSIVMSTEPQKPLNSDFFCSICLPKRQEHSHLIYIHFYIPLRYGSVLLRIPFYFRLTFYTNHSFQCPQHFENSMFVLYSFFVVISFKIVIFLFYRLKVKRQLPSLQVIKTFSIVKSSPDLKN